MSTCVESALGACDFASASLARLKQRFLTHLTIAGQRLRPRGSSDLAGASAIARARACELRACRLCADCAHLAAMIARLRDRLL